MPPNALEVVFAAVLELDKRDVAQLGSARRSGRRGRQFESGHPDSDKKATSAGAGVAFLRAGELARVF